MQFRHVGQNQMQTVIRLIWEGPDLPESANPKIEAKPKAPNPKVTHLIAKYDEELTTEALNNLVCAHVSENEIVTLLEDYAGEVKVRKMNGRIGWASENVFKVHDRMKLPVCFVIYGLLHLRFND